MSETTKTELIVRHRQAAGLCGSHYNTGYSSICITCANTAEALKKAYERGRREENEAWQEITRRVEAEIATMEIDGDCESGNQAYAVGATKVIRIQGRARMEAK